MTQRSSSPTEGRGHLRPRGCLRLRAAIVATVLAVEAWTATAAGAATGRAATGSIVGVCAEEETLGAPGRSDPPDAVRELQLGLRLLGRLAHPITGIYDERTREAVRRFQAEQGLVPDGVVGPRTWEALAKAYEQEVAGLAAMQRTPPGSATGARRLPSHPERQPGGYWIVVDTTVMELTLYRGDQVVHRWPVAVGKPSTVTPVGEWRVVRKDRDWGGGFGTRWLGLDVPWGMYGIHGTNKPWSIGTRASGGCIRMFNDHVERLWDMVSEGTPVTIVGVLPEATWDSPIPAGASGWNVPILQWALRGQGFDAGRADGRMGPQTMQAIAEAERQWALPPVAAATPDLFRALGLKR